MEFDPLRHITSAIEINPLNTETGLSITAVLLLLLLSFITSGSETAFFSLSRQDIKKLQDSNSAAGKIILLLLDKPQKLMANILITKIFINIGIVIICLRLSRKLSVLSAGPAVEGILLTAIITFLLLIFGEISAKEPASRAGMKFAKFTSYPILIAGNLFSPLSSFLVKTSSVFEKPFKREPGISPDDLTEAIEYAGKDKTEEKKILEGIVSFSNLEVKEIMKPRIDVVLTDINADFDELIKIISNSGYSRIPVYNTTPDRIKGIIYAKDLLEHLNKSKQYKWQKHIRTAYFVPETMKINELLEQFRRKKIHMAIVSDEFGGISGIVTLEDIIEEIVGEITDETDQAEENFIKTGPNTFEFDAKIQINDFYKLLNIKDDVFGELRKESDSVAGIILELQHKIPEKGEIINFKNLQFTILEADSRRIKRIRLKIH